MPAPLFTPETAREMQKRANEARKRNKLAKLLAPPEPPALTPLSPQSQYCADRLSLVRKQLARIDAMLFEETDPAKLDRLASATAKLAEQERQLADRPLPGTKKPDSRQPRAVVEPESEPVPIVASAPQ